MTDNADREIAMMEQVDQIKKYREIFSCLSQIAHQFHELDAGAMIDLFEQCGILSNDIVLQETDKLYLESWNQIRHMLKWQCTAYIEMILEKCGSLDGKPSEAVPASDVDVLPEARGTCSDEIVSLDKTACALPTPVNDREVAKAVARQQTIAATRQDPGPGGLEIVAGLAEAKKLLREAVVLPLQYPHLFTGGRRSWNRVLLYGPPGTGKTRLAQAIASEVRAAFYCISSADILSSWVGESEKLIRELFQYPRLQGERAIVFIDEIDSICRRRTTQEEEHTRRMKTELMSQFEGATTSNAPDSIFVLCATNCPWDLDPAFLRRFQRRIYIPLPDRLARQQILSLHSQGTATCLSDADWQLLLDRTDGYSGSDLANLTICALLEPLADLDSCTHWIHTSGDRLMPCANNTPGLVRRFLKDIPSHMVATRDVVLSDYLKSLTTTPKTVIKADIDKFTNFTHMFGQIG